VADPRLPPRVLVVEDEENIAYLLTSAFRLDGYEVAHAPNGRQALADVRDFRPDVVLLDVMLPDLDGFEVCRRLRQEHNNVPVLFLTARDATGDRVKGLTIGGDDYVVKPFAIEEVLARAKVMLRRNGMGNPSGVLRLADLELDENAHVVRRHGEPVKLSPTEYKLLHYLLLNQGRALSRHQILDHVWDYGFEGDTSVVDTFVSYLRRKVDRVEPKLIQTVRGIGYCLREE
jgi:two-component system, OmpR family, response regulator